MREIDYVRISDACTDILDEIESIINENNTDDLILSVHVLKSIADKVSGIQTYVYAFKDAEELPDDEEVE